MTLEKAIKMLEAEYERAKTLNYVRDPLAYALHLVWRRVEEKRRKEKENEDIPSDDTEVAMIANLNDRM